MRLKSDQTFIPEPMSLCFDPSSKKRITAVITSLKQYTGQKIQITKDQT